MSERVAKRVAKPERVAVGTSKRAFLEALAGTTPFMHWEVSVYGLRAERKHPTKDGQPDYCPITAVASVNQVGEFEIGDADSEECRKALSMRLSLAGRIINAADLTNEEDPGAPKGTVPFRREMEKALGLAEK